ATAYHRLKRFDDVPIVRNRFRTPNNDRLNVFERLAPCDVRKRYNRKTIEPEQIQRKLFLKYLPVEGLMCFFSQVRKVKLWQLYFHAFTIKMIVHIYLKVLCQTACGVHKLIDRFEDAFRVTVYFLQNQRIHDSVSVGSIFTSVRRRQGRRNRRTLL